jgi:hypothetical protein
VIDIGTAGFGQQLLDDSLGLLIRALAKVVVPDRSVGVREIERGPVSVGERVPDRVVAVDRDRIPDVSRRRFPLHVLDLALERELGRVDADHDEPGVPVLLVPCPHVRQLAQPVDAGVRPEADEHDVPA